MGRWREPNEWATVQRGQFTMPRWVMVVRWYHGEKFLPTIRTGRRLAIRYGRQLRRAKRRRGQGRG